MPHGYTAIAFTDSVRNIQTSMGSRQAYERFDIPTGVDADDPSVSNRLLGEREIEFISKRDSFYMASVSETGWPYVQHRGGPAGFIRVIDNQTIGFADFRGNRQYVSVGNFVKDDRVSLFFMDYANRKRLKAFGRVRLVDLDHSELSRTLNVGDYKAKTEHNIVIDIEAFDWNCPQHITPRFTASEWNEGAFSDPS